MTIDDKTGGNTNAKITYYISGPTGDYYFYCVDDGQAMGVFDDYLTVVYDKTANYTLHRMDKEGNTAIKQYYGLTDNPPAGSKEGTSEVVDNLVPGEQMSGYQVNDATPPVVTPKTPTTKTEVDYLGSALFLIGLGIVGFTLWYIWKHREAFKQFAGTVVMAPAKVVEIVENKITPITEAVK